MINYFSMTSAYRSPASLLAAASALILSCAPLHAGSFGGPRPFSGGSPLVTGTDGIYQAVATAKNASGIISWEIINGAQTSSTANNSWSFFVDGQTLTGNTTANVSQGKVAGVLESADTFAIDEGSITLPAVFIFTSNDASGDFKGTIDFSTRNSSIDGSGRLRGTPQRTYTIFVVDALGFPSESRVTEPASDFGSLSFDLRGTRVSTSASSTGS